MDPVSKLNRQIVRLEGRIADLQTRADRLANVRLITGFGALAAVLAVGAFGPPWAFWLALALGVIGFGAAVIAHRRLTVAVDRFSGWLAIKRRHVARATLDWEALPPSPLTPAPEHAFEQDIDLLDLHRMLNTCASAGGAHLLYDWLTVHRPDPAVIEARQALVADLTPLAPFRDKLELAGQGVRPLHFDPEPVPAALPPIIAAMGLLAAVDVVLFGLVLLERIAPLVLVAALAVYGGLFLLAFPLTNRTLSTAIDSTDVLHRLSVVTGFIEGYRYGHSDRLRQAAAPILNDRPSAALGGLGWLAGAASMRRNPFLGVPLNVIVPWDPVVAWLLMRRINALAPKLDGWLACWHRLEALSALAAFSWLRPAATFPRLDEGGPLFAAEAMGHPPVSYTHL
ncbi:MAG: hypothetical protein GYB64_16750, partial [Chloroflexi bacterium]|nr:hypothetical protein [Chloroflexota bacterium]